MKFHGTTTGRMQGKSIRNPQQLASLQANMQNIPGQDPTQYGPVYTRKGLLQLTTDVMWLTSAAGVWDVYRLQVSVFSSAVPGPGKSITPGVAARMLKVMEESMEVPATTSRADQKQFLETMCEIVAVRKERPYRLVNPIMAREPQKTPTLSVGRATDMVFMDDVLDVDMADLEKRVAAYCAADVDLTKQLFTGATTWPSKT